MFAFTLLPKVCELPMVQKVVIGIAAGAIAYIVLFRMVFNYIMLITMDCEALTAYDSCMM